MATSRGLRNYNPGNIRISTVKYRGEVVPSKDRAFKQFSTMAYGYRAMFVILRTYYQKYHLTTIRKMIHRWAPPSENDTQNYVDHVARWSGIPADTTLEISSREMMCAVVAAMSRMENGVKADMNDIIKGWYLI